MGKTFQTAVQLIDDMRKKFDGFRRALRKEDQELFDRIWEAARYHAAPISEANHVIFMETIVMTMILSLEGEIQNLKQRCEQILAYKGSGDGQGTRRMDI
jgi:hypothetical protein